jgi:hypothetical protein
VTDEFPGGRHAASAVPWLFGGAAIVVAVFGIAFAVTLTGNSTPLGPAPQHHSQATTPPPSATATAAAKSASPTPTARKRAHKRTPSASPTSPTTQPAVAFQPASPTQSAAAHLAASVSLDTGPGSHGFGLVVFQVTDTGSAATGPLTATITLPAGASAFGGGGGGGDGGDHGRGSTDWAWGWSCQPTSTGATCQRAGIAAGSRAVGTIYITINGDSACGGTVELVASSGSASASAQSPSGISC